MTLPVCGISLSERRRELASLRVLGFAGADGTAIPPRAMLTGLPPSDRISGGTCVTD